MNFFVSFSRSVVAKSGNGCCKAHMISLVVFMFQSMSCVMSGDTLSGPLRGVGWQVGVEKVRTEQCIDTL